MTSRFGREKGYIQPRAAVQENHIDKRKRRNRDLEIVFDPTGHKDYVTGFRKRKIQRRKEAVKQLEKLSKEQKLEERAERKAAKREQYERFLKPVVPDNDADDADDSAGEERAFDDGSKRQTVRVMPIRTEEDEEAFEAQLERKKKALAASKTDSKTDDDGLRKKMTKKGLSVLTNTKMKLMGKHRFDGAKRKKKDDGSKSGPAGKGAAPTRRKGQKRKGRK